MKKLLLLTAFSFIMGWSFSQTVTLKHAGYTSVFDTIHHIPFYTYYVLTPKELKSTVKYSRMSTFSDDPLISKSKQATNKEYDRSGYDKGHMVDADDMGYSKESEAQCFYFTNIVPQNSKLNRGQWKELEDHARREALVTDSLLIITGAFDFKVRLTNTWIPDTLFKIIYNYATAKTETYIIPNQDIDDYKKYLINTTTIANIKFKDIINKIK